MTKTTSKRKTAKKPRIDVDRVRDAAAGRWLEILSAVGGISRELLDGRHHPCPLCRGTDRFRLVDRDAGAVLCNKCFTSRNGDGFAAISWVKGTDFLSAARAVADYLGVDDSGGSSYSSKRENADPAAHLEWRPWNDAIIALWCRHKPPVTPEGVRAAGGRLARYRNQYIVVAFPVWGQNLDSTDPVGWSIINTTGGPLPRLSQDGQVDWIKKPKLTYGSSPGLIGDLNRLRSAEVVWKLEGVSDVLAWLSMDGIPPDHAVVTNAMGCQERPAKWMVNVIAGTGKRAVHVLHDADVPGQRGAVGWSDNGRHRPGWAEEISTAAKECRNVSLPFPVAESHGQDFRDWLKCGGTFDELRKLAAAGSAIKPAGSHANEQRDDPYRLARLNLERYATKTNGRTLRYWSGSWWVWKNNRYVCILEDELHAKVTASVKEEFNRINAEEMEDYRVRKEAGELQDGEKPPYVQKVTPHLVNSVLKATRAMTCLSGETELDTWIPDRKRRNYLSMANGLLDVDALLSDSDNVLLPHSPEWFSNVHLPYNFDPKARCPKWDAFLEKNLETDPERIKLLQEWAGYLLLPDTGEQRFMIFEGEGANGKSVACAAIEAMLGGDNCSHVQFEVFGDRFSKTMTLGKLVNICGDAGEIDQVAEGVIKAFTAGNTMLFDRKGLPGITCQPTARLMIACNNLPRFRDRTEGVWRRVLLIPWQVTIGPRDRIKNMDKAWWWQQTGELPGIFNWAVAGLHRLKRHGGFSDSEVMKQALAEYKAESNPARQFLLDNLASFAVTDNVGQFLKCSSVYKAYNKWARDNGYFPLSERQFGKEVKRAFPRSARLYKGTRSNRAWCYVGIDFCEGSISPDDWDSAYIQVSDS